MCKNIGASDSDNSIMEFDINVEIIPKYTAEEMKSAMNNRGEPPDVEVISGLKAAIITYKIEPDYEAFIESVEDLLTEYYGLELFYMHKPDGHSKYYSFLAKDKTSSKVYFEFRLRLDILNHPANRTGAFQKHNIEAADTERNMELTEDVSKDPRPYSIRVTVNNAQFDSYETAFVDTDEKIMKWIEEISRNPIAMQ